jgi:hypothetical protein
MSEARRDVLTAVFCAVLVIPALIVVVQGHEPRWLWGLGLAALVVQALLVAARAMRRRGGPS